MNRASINWPYKIFIYATAKLITLSIAITHIAGEVLENFPVNNLIKA